MKTSELPVKAVLRELTVGFEDECPRGLTTEQLKYAIWKALEQAGFDPLYVDAPKAEGR